MAAASLSRTAVAVLGQRRRARVPLQCAMDADRASLDTCELKGVGRGSGWREQGVFTPLSREVKNDGSTARDHLSNERTLLAWVRTSVAMLALVRVTRMYFQRRGEPPGAF